MAPFRPQTLVLVVLTALCACASPAGQPPGASYFWLPVLGVTENAGPEARVRGEVESTLMSAGYTRTGTPALALAISTDEPRNGDGSLGLGPYAGGYSYIAPQPAPAGFIDVTAYDARTLRCVWRVRIARDVALQGNAIVLRQRIASAMTSRAAAL